MVLSKMSKEGNMILLFVRTNNLRKNPPKEGEFSRAWYRLNNEDTNQTIDYKQLKNVEKPEGFDEDAPLNNEEEQEGAEEANGPEAIYLAGRVYFSP